MSFALFECESYEGYRMPKEFTAIKEKLDNFQCRNDDIWVTSYVKSGCTWLQEMVWLIANNLDYEKAKLLLDRRFFFIETEGLDKCWLKFSKENGLVNKLDLIEVPDILELIDKMQVRRFFYTHLPWYLMPKQIRDGTRSPKIIHIMRNPKQVVPSYYYHSTKIFPTYKGNLDNFVDLFMDGKLLFGGYFNTVLSYWQQRYRPNLLFLTYEEMQDNLKGSIRKVAHFLERSYSEEQIEKLAKHLSFSEMKNNPAVNKQFYIQNINIQYMREGTIDGYKRELTKEMIDKLDKWIDKNAKGTNFPYEKK